MELDKKWMDDFKKPFIISGPCSAENQAQILETAKSLDKNHIEIFRSGIWKPRTNPEGFEGVGERGFMWLKEAKKQTGLKIAIEVANASHVELAIKNDIDILWIGARTTANSFFIEEIANALAGTDKIILVKNPMHTDLKAWIGAVKRLNLKGIKKLGVIHRGFSTFIKTNYRNEPFWNLALELKMHYPELPLICDVSHICGNDKDIFKVIKKALSLGYEGIMVETHFDPSSALSDAQQQIKPEKLNSFLSSNKNKFFKKKDISEKRIQKIKLKDINRYLFHLLKIKRAFYTSKASNKNQFSNKLKKLFLDLMNLKK